MRPRKIKTGIYCVGAIDWDRRLFDALIPLPDGTSYNSYLIKGKEKTALVDTVDPSMLNVLLGKLGSLGINKINYVISHHAEQDHSGSIPAMLDKFPTAKVVCSPRCQELLVELLLLSPDKIKTVADKETLSLGDKTLEFIHTPWVHWPETMSTYVREDKVLFSCDMFGSHIAQTATFVTDEAQVHESAKRYYAEIMMPFRRNVISNVEKLKDYNIGVIAPSHGPCYDKPGFIIDAYREWTSDTPKNIVVMPYVSMHGSTHRMVAYLNDALAARGVAVKQFDMTSADLGKLAMSLVDAATVVIGTPTVLAGPHPLMVNAAFLANLLRPITRFATIIGSYGWGGKTVEQITALLPNLKVEVLTPVLCKGYPKEADFQALDKMADTIAAKHKEAGLY